MTEQEYKAKQNELKQVRQNISDLGKREKELRREIAKYDASVYMDKYYYDEKCRLWLKPIKMNGEFLYFISISKYTDAESYIPDYVIEETYYSLDCMKDIVEVPKGRFVENVNKILKEAKKTIFGDDVK